MEKIKFSHNYPKLNNEKEAKLLVVFVSETSKLSSSLIEYDTVYYTKLGEKMNYPLPDSTILLLLFLGRNGTVFTTIRPYFFKNELFYRGRIDKWFTVEVKKNAD